MDIKLHYVEQGSGTPLILLHGNGDSHAYFEHQMEAFSKHFRVIAVDTRGHGQSPRGTAEFTLLQFAKDLNDFMDELGIEKAHVLGFSDGGNIALLFALHFPHRVLRLVSDGADLNPSGVKFSVQFGILCGYWMTKIISVFDKKCVPKHEILSLMVGQPNIKKEELQKLSMPVLVMAGDNDMIKANHTPYIASCIPNATLCIIKGDHFIAAKNPEDFNRAVLDFLLEE